jgi:hypothetical protein
LRRQDIADPLVADPKAILPMAVAGVLRRELLCDREAVPVGLERPVQIALRDPQVADLGEADREVALPLRIANASSSRASASEALPARPSTPAIRPR